MSWSYNGCGRAGALIAVAQASLANVKCAEPEETVKAKVSEIIETALTAYPANTAVKVVAHGSQSTRSPADGGIINSVSLTIEPIYGFVE